MNYYSDPFISTRLVCIAIQNLNDVNPICYDRLSSFTCYCQKFLNHGQYNYFELISTRPYHWVLGFGFMK